MFDDYRELLGGVPGEVPNTAQMHPDPVAIGGVGGSGTRVLAELLGASSLAMASPVNRALDAYEWPPLGLLSESCNKVDRDRTLAAALHVFERLLDERRARLNKSGRVAWKVPGTFLWLRHLSSYFPDMQYIHLIRNGLDMAYSRNQRQARRHGRELGVDLEFRDGRRLAPASVLDYWLAGNEQAIREGEALLGSRFLLLRFEDLCSAPVVTLQCLEEFLDLPLLDALPESLLEQISTPPTVDRYLERNWQTDFSSQQLERVGRLGYRP